MTAVGGFVWIMSTAVDVGSTTMLGLRLAGGAAVHYATTVLPRIVRAL